MTRTTKLAILVLSGLLIASIYGNYFLFDMAVRGSYDSDFKNRHARAVSTLAILTDTTREKQEIVALLDANQIDWRKRPAPHSNEVLQTSGLELVFDADSDLVRIDYWLHEMSPLYERASQ